MENSQLNNNEILSQSNEKDYYLKNLPKVKYKKLWKKVVLEKQKINFPIFLSDLITDYNQKLYEIIKRKKSPNQLPELPNKTKNKKVLVEENWLKYAENCLKTTDVRKSNYVLKIINSIRKSKLKASNRQIVIVKNGINGIFGI